MTGERAIEHGAPVFPSAPAADLDQTIDMRHALDRLPARQREVIVLHLVEGFSFLEIGRQTGVSLFTAAGRYRLGITRLRRIWKGRT